MPNTSSTHRRASRVSRKPGRAAQRTAARKASSSSDKTQGAEGDRARTFWAGTLSFGLVSIPVELVPATRRKRAPLRMLAPDGTPLARRFYSASDDRLVKAKELARGFEIKKGQYVVITDQELRALDPERTRDINLQSFVDAQEISPLYFDRAYYLVPARGAAKAYGLLASVMEELGQAGIATFVMHDSEHVIAIYAVDGVLRGQTLRFFDEVRQPDDMDFPSIEKVQAASVKKLDKALASAARHRFAPTQLKDDSADKVIALAEAKQRKGKDVIEVSTTTPTEQPMADVIDLMEALKASIKR